MRISSLATLLPLASASPILPGTEPAPLYTRDVSPDMADRYIVKFKDGSAMSTVQEAMKNIADSTHTFENIFKGFAAKLNKPAVERLRMLPDVSAPLEVRAGALLTRSAG